jgi:hypothetical protein
MTGKKIFVVPKSRIPAYLKTRSAAAAAAQR